MSNKHLELDNFGRLAGTSLTTGYQDLITLTDDVEILFFYNSSDVSVTLSIPCLIRRSPTPLFGTKEWRIPANGSFAIDGRANSKSIPKGVIQVKATGAGTTGEVVINVAR